MKSGSKGPGRRWDRDPDVIDRLEEHERIMRTMATKRAAREYICEKQDISLDTFYKDEDRIKKLRLMRIAENYDTLVAEVDTSLREVVDDADLMTVRAADDVGMAMHQGNKLRGIAARMKLHGLAKPEKHALTNAAGEDLIPLEELKSMISKALGGSE